MIQVKSIYANNFMSIRDLKFDFENQCYVIKGQNLDDNGQGSNGSGKTAFIEIIPIALLGSSLSGRNLKDCVNWQSEDKSFTVGAVLQDEVNTYEIERTVYNNTKSAELKILVNGEVPETLPSKKGIKNGVDVRAGKEFILHEILNIAEDDLVNYYFISKKYTSFLEANIDGKLSVISRFTNTKQVDLAIDFLKKEIKENTRLLEESKSERDRLEGSIETLLQSVDDTARARFEENKQKQIGDHNDNILVLGQKLLDTEDEIKGCMEKAKSFHIQEEKNDLILELNEVIKVANDEINQKQNDANQASKLKEVIQTYLNGMVTCPKCDHHFQPYDSSEYTQEDLAFVIETHREKVQEIEELKKIIEACREEIDKLEQVKADNRQKQQQLKACKQEMTTLQTYSDNLSQKINWHEEKIKELEASEFKDDVSDKIEDKQSDLAAISNDIAEYMDTLDKYNEWINHFENFKFYLGNRPIQLICSLVNQYLIMNGSDLNLHIEGFKKLRSGELRQDLTPIIYRNWMNPQPYTQFSGGERVRLNIAVDLAFQQLINSTSKSGGLDFYMSDEILNPLDSDGVANAAKAFNNLNKTMLLVTHSGADLVYENVITLTKQKGETCII